MAQRRMISKELFNEDGFLMLSHDAMVLYVYLCLNADDDGFVSNPVMVMRSIGSTAGDKGELENAEYVIDFDNGVLLIRHWKMMNTIPAQKYKETTRLSEKSQVYEDERKVYHLYTKSIREVDTDKSIDIDESNLDTDEDSIDNDSVDKELDRGQKNLGYVIPWLNTESIPKAYQPKQVKEYDGDF